MSQRRCPYAKHLLALLSLAACFWIAVPAGAQLSATQDHDTTGQQLSSFDAFMDRHPETAQQLRKNPSLIQDKDFVASHPDLQEYFRENPGVREELQENPNAFMHQEKRLDARETRQEVVNFDHFLDKHPEIAEQLRKDPSLVNNKQWVNSHPELQKFLEGYSGLAEDLHQNPNAFMQKEDRYDQRDDGMNRGGMDRNGMDRDRNRGAMASMDSFLDSHPEIAEQVRKDPSLLTNQKFVKQHPALQSYLQQNPQVRQEISQNPNNFMQREQRFDQREDGMNRDGMNRDGMDRDRNRGEITGMDRFLDSHPEIAEQLKKDPSLLTNKKFVDQHPALQTYLQQNPQVRQEAAENPNGFMQQEQRYDRQENNYGQNRGRFDSDVTRGEVTSFGQFLNSHDSVAQQLAKNPSLATNEEFMANHPELKAYLQAHPGAQEELKENPQAFVQSAQQMSKPAPKGTMQRPQQQKQY